MAINFWPPLQLIAYARIGQGILYTFDLEILKDRFMFKGFVSKDYIQQIREKVSVITLPAFTTTFTHLSSTPTRSEGLKHLLLPTGIQKQLVGIIMALGLEVRKWFKSHSFIFQNGNLDLRKRLAWFSFGIVDRFKTARNFILDENVSIIERFHLACQYYLEDDVRRLWTIISTEEQDHLPKTRCVQLWLRVLNIRIPVGWEIMLLHEGQIFFSRNYLGISNYFRKLRKPGKRYLCILSALGNENVHHFDLYLCLSQINDNELNDMLTHLTVRNLVCVFECFLHWPFQIMFLDVVNDFERFINGNIFLKLIISILSNKLAMGWQDYQYIDLLGSFWYLSSAKCKNYFIKNYEEIYEVVIDVLKNSHILYFREYQHLAKILRRINSRMLFSK